MSGMQTTCQTKCNDAKAGQAISNGQSLLPRFIPVYFSFIKLNKESLNLGPGLKRKIGGSLSNYIMTLDPKALDVT